MKILIATSAVMAEDKYSWYTYKSSVPMHIPFKKSYNVLQSGQRFGLRSASTGDKTRMIFEGKPTLVMSLTPAETALLVERSNGKPLPKRQVAAVRKANEQQVALDHYNPRLDRDANGSLLGRLGERVMMLKARRLSADFAELNKMSIEKGITLAEIKFYKDLSNKFKSMGTAKKPVTADVFVTAVNDLIVAAKMDIKKAKAIKSVSSISTEDIDAAAKAFRLKTKNLNDIKGIFKGLPKGSFNMNSDKYQEISYDALEFSNVLLVLQSLGTPTFAKEEKAKGTEKAIHSIVSKQSNLVIDDIQTTSTKAVWSRTLGIYYN